MTATREELIELLRDAQSTFGHSHWDATMKSGAGCPACIAQRHIRARIAAALGEEIENPRMPRDADRLNVGDIDVPDPAQALLGR